MIRLTASAKKRVCNSLFFIGDIDPSKAHLILEHGGGGGNFSAKTHMPFLQGGGTERRFSEEFSRFSPRVDP